MHKRSEPRFQVQSAVKIAALDQPADLSDALLLDVSGAGMKIIADVWWPVDTRIVVEMENHVVVAVVRNVNPRGPKFSLGAEKLHSVLKHTLPLDLPREEWHSLLLAEIGQFQETPALMRESSDVHQPGMIESVSFNGSGAHDADATRLEVTGEQPEQPPAAVLESAAAEISTEQTINVPVESVAAPQQIAAREPSGEILPGESLPEQVMETASVSEAHPDARPAETETEPPEEPQVQREPGLAAPHAALEAASDPAPELGVNEMLQKAVAEPDTFAPHTLAPHTFAPHLGLMGRDFMQSSLAVPPADEQPPARRPVFAPQATYTSQEILPQLTMALQPLPHEEFSFDAIGEEESAENGAEMVTPDAVNQEIAETSASPVIEEIVVAGEPEEASAEDAEPAAAIAAHNAASGNDAIGNDAMRNDAAEAQESESAAVQPAAAPEIPETNEIAEAHDADRAADTKLDADHEPEVFAMKLPDAPQDVSAPVSPDAYSLGLNAPPMASLLPKLPAISEPGRHISPSKVAPQFGPAYGMAPTADVLTPISTMPAAQPEPEVRQSSKWIASSGLAAALLVVAALAFYYGPFRPTATSATRTTTPLASAISKPSQSETPQPSPAAHAPASSATQTNAKPATVAASSTPAASPQPTPAVVAKASPPPLPAPRTTPAPTVPARAAASLPSAIRHAVLTASSLNWVSVCSDKKAQFSKVLHEGDTIEIDFQHAAVFHIGTAGASKIDVDGKNIGPIGAPGQVKVLEIDDAGTQTLSVSADSRCGQLRASAKP